MLLFTCPKKCSKNETEETIGFVVIIFIISGFSLGGPFLPPLPVDTYIIINSKHKKKMLDYKAIEFNVLV